MPKVVAMVWILNVPQRLCSKGLVWYYWEVVEPLRGGASWEVFRSLIAHP
jgi:hypothetical protein